MSIPVSELTETDYLILEYINRFDSVHKDQIERHFKGKIDALDYRLSVLAKLSYKTSGGSPYPVTNSNFIAEEYDVTNDSYRHSYNPTGIFSITPLGKSALQDYFSKQKHDTKEMWLKNVWIPIIVSFVTTSITMYLIPKLPLMLKWLCDTLSKIFS